ncbi:DUF732 domain-containing protein [Streptacidiphilus cavernicola]|uniref:DUF732 domain-containing protein n=1 Tax=Streptacidiphilus cavernicola TaxID=3342716 RepID=A0ABV6W5N2_9ACTN
MSNRQRARLLTTAVAIAAGLATVTGCSRSAGAASAPSPNAAAISAYISDMRSLTATTLPDAQRFSPNQSSDTQLIALGEQTCTDLQDHKPIDVVGLLEKKGWSRNDAGDIVMGATRKNTLCPDQYQAVNAMISAAGG